jgi:hypothetical protein
MIAPSSRAGALQAACASLEKSNITMSAASDINCADDLLLLSKLTTIKSSVSSIRN